MKKLPTAAQDTAIANDVERLRAIFWKEFKLAQRSCIPRRQSVGILVSAARVGRMHMHERRDKASMPSVNTASASSWNKLSDSVLKNGGLHYVLMYVNL
jgi:hypothetical protein